MTICPMWSKGMAKPRNKTDLEKLAESKEAGMVADRAHDPFDGYIAK